MSRRQWQKLQREGIRVACFFPPFLGRLNLRVNYRNHRKIVVIDGNLGYVGGFNIGKEYISKDPKFGYWRDTHLKIRGMLPSACRSGLPWTGITPSMRICFYLGNISGKPRRMKCWGSIW